MMLRKPTSKKKKNPENKENRKSPCAKSQLAKRRPCCMRRIQLKSLCYFSPFPFALAVQGSAIKCARLVLASPLFVTNQSCVVFGFFLSFVADMFRVSSLFLFQLRRSCVAQMWVFCSTNGLVEQERFAHVFDFRNRAAQVEGF